MQNGWERTRYNCIQFCLIVRQKDFSWINSDFTRRDIHNGSRADSTLVQWTIQWTRISPVNFRIHLNLLLQIRWLTTAGRKSETVRICSSFLAFQLKSSLCHQHFKWKFQMTTQNDEKCTAFETDRLKVSWWKSHSSALHHSLVHTQYEVHLNK